MNAVILFVVIAILIYMIYIFNRISEIKSKTDKIADGVKDLYLQINHAVTDTKLDELTREVRAHNNFAQRMPVVEHEIKVINHRLNDLERE